MGIDGRVYCNCLKEGKTTPPPFEQSYICQDQESGFWYIKEDLPEDIYAVKNLAVLLQASLDTQNPIYYG